MGRTPLHVAAMHGMGAVIDILLHADSIDVNKPDDDKLTALDYADAAGLVRTVRQLRHHFGTILTSPCMPPGIIATLP